jgi:hypothetical protein
MWHWRTRKQMPWQQLLLLLRVVVLAGSAGGEAEEAWG